MDRSRGQPEAAALCGICIRPFCAGSEDSLISTPGVLRLFGETERDTVSAEEIARIREGLASGCPCVPFAAHRGSSVRVSEEFPGSEGS